MSTCDALVTYVHAPPAVTAEPRSSVQVACRSLTPDDVEVLEIGDDDADYTEIITADNGATFSNETAGDGDDDSANEIDGLFRFSLNYMYVYM